jgi:hypothetical protein
MLQRFNKRISTQLINPLYQVRQASSQYSTVQYRTVQYSTVQYSTVVGGQGDPACHVAPCAVGHDLLLHPAFQASRTLRVLLHMHQQHPLMLTLELHLARGRPG